MNIPQKLADEFQLRQEQIDNTIALLDDGKTIPFIARYRKERTGSLDDQVLLSLIHISEPRDGATSRMPSSA